MNKTLAELKAENAALEAEQKPVEEVIPIQEPEQQQEQEQQPEELKPEGDKETAVEAWMAEETEEQASNSGNFKSSDLRGLRLKMQARIDEKDQEIERLRQEVEKIKQGTQQPEQSLGDVPTLEDFDFDKAQFQAAMQAWLLSQVGSVTKAKEEQLSKQRQREALELKVNSHYERAENLVKQAKIDPNLYAQADKSFRMIFEAVFPGNGDVAADRIIAHLGDGSEKLSYHFGRNSQKQEILKAKLIEDPSGLSATAYLSRVMGEITQPAQKTTKAPPPAARAEGGVGSVSGADLKRKYESSKDPQTRISLKRQAKRDGIDVSNWN